MNPEANLDLAKFLALPPRGVPEEASLRGACGRAYYSAFGVARDLLIAARFAVGADRSTHAEVARLLRESSDPAVQAAGGSLDALRRVRNSADYDVGARSSMGGLFDRRRSQMAVASASVIIRAIKNASSADPRLGIPAQVR